MKSISERCQRKNKKKLEKYFKYSIQNFENFVGMTNGSTILKHGNIDTSSQTTYLDFMWKMIANVVYYYHTIHNF